MNPAKNDREGYEWFGGTAPPHEALTAYGLLEFRDMARVQDVDPAMLKRTQDYLLSRRDGKGGFQRNPRACDSFGRAPDDVTNAYIVWALTESGKDDDLTTELNALAGQAKTSKDPYFLALVANSLINRARTDEATALLKTVAGAQKEDGRLDAEKTSITGSGGRDLQIETTALAVLGWLKANPGAFADSLRKGRDVDRQAARRLRRLRLDAIHDPGAEGADRLHPRQQTDGRGRRIAALRRRQGGGGVWPFPAGASDALTLELKDAETVLHPGKNDVRDRGDGQEHFPVHAGLVVSDAQAGQRRRTVRCDCKRRCRRRKVREGDLVRLKVTLEQRERQGPEHGDGGDRPAGRSDAAGGSQAAQAALRGSRRTGRVRW